jgi:hypothetical protein
VVAKEYADNKGMAEEPLEEETVNALFPQSNGVATVMNQGEES